MLFIIGDPDRLWAIRESWTRGIAAVAVHTNIPLALGSFLMGKSKLLSQSSCYERASSKSVENELWEGIVVSGEKGTLAEAAR